MKTQPQIMFGNYLQKFVNISVNPLFDSVPPLKASSSQAKRKAKTHDYTESDRGSHYVFESTDDETIGYMTARGNNVQPGEYVLLPEEDRNNSCLYRVEEIDYYANPADMWIARLKKVSSPNQLS